MAAWGDMAAWVDVTEHGVDVTVHGVDVTVYGVDMTLRKVDLMAGLIHRKVGDAG